MVLINTVLAGLHNHPNVLMRESLVYVANHIVEDGISYYTGFIFNRKSSDSVAQSVVDNYPGIDRDHVFFGGSMYSQSTALFLHSRDYESKRDGGRITMHPNAPFAITTGKDPWFDMCEGGGPDPYKLILGYCQWPATELEFQVEGLWLEEFNFVLYEKEINPVWARIQPDADMILKTEGSWREKWEEALERYGQEKVASLVKDF